MSHLPSTANNNAEDTLAASGAVAKNVSGHGADAALGHAALGHDAQPILKRPSALAIMLMVLAFLALLAGLFAIGWIPNRAAIQQAAEDAHRIQNLVFRARVVRPHAASTMPELVLPCDVHAYQATAIYPRANGYLKKLYVDIQSAVKAGDLLAEIDTPEIDAQLAQAKAALAQAVANADKAQSDLELAQATLRRYEDSKGSVAEQSIEERRTAYDQTVSALKQAKANIDAARANVDQLATIQSFEKVSAPFSGVITIRNYDVGALLNPSNFGPGFQLFDIAQVDVMRVVVSIPQTHATEIKIGQPATLAVSNYPGRKFSGTVARNAGAIDISTRTMRFELDFPNPDGALLAGMYGDAHVGLSQDHPTLVIPTGALVFNANGKQVATVRDGKIAFRDIVVGRDLGTDLEVLSGLTSADQIVTNPTGRLVEGLAVETVPGESAPAQETPKAAVSQAPRAKE